MKLTESSEILKSVKPVRVVGNDIYDNCDYKIKSRYVFAVYKWDSHNKLYNWGRSDAVAIIHFGSEMSAELMDCLHGSVLFGLSLNSVFLGLDINAGYHDVYDLKKGNSYLLLCDILGRPVFKSDAQEERNKFHAKIIDYIRTWIPDIEADANSIIVRARGTGIHNTLI